MRTLAVTDAQVKAAIRILIRVAQGSETTNKQAAEMLIAAQALADKLTDGDPGPTILIAEAIRDSAKKVTP